MSALTNNTVQSTYQSLLKTADNGVVNSTLKNVTDGLGNPTALFLDNNDVAVSGSLTVTGSLKATQGITGSLFGTASYTLTASYAINGGGGSIDTGSFSTTGSNTFIGNQIITGSVDITGSLTLNGAAVGGLPYKVYTALLSQEGTNDPVATVLENTLGSDIVWKRSGSQGIYYGENVNFSDPSKVWMLFSPNYSNQGYGVVYQVSGEIYNDGPGNALWFTTNNVTAGNAVDNWETYISVEIRVYP